MLGDERTLTPLRETSMSSKHTSLLIGTGLLALSAVAMAKPASIENPLRVGVFADTSANNAFTGSMQFKITNTSNRAIKVPSW